MADDKHVPTPAEIWEILRGVGETQAETAKGLERLRERTDSTLAAVADLVADGKSMRKELGGLGRSCGNMAESLLVGNVLETLNRHPAIKVTFLSGNVSGGSKKAVAWEIDGFALGSEMAVIVEAKAKLTVQHIDHFVKSTIPRFRKEFFATDTRRLHGAVGYLQAEKDAVAQAQAQGLLVIRSTHDHKEIINAKGFVPRDFHRRNTSRKKRCC